MPVLIAFLRTCYFRLYFALTVSVITSYSIHYTKLYDPFCWLRRYRGALHQSRSGWDDDFSRKASDDVVGSLWTAPRRWSQGFMANKNLPALPSAVWGARSNPWGHNRAEYIWFRGIRPRKNFSICTGSHAGTAGRVQCVPLPLWHMTRVV